MSFEELFDEDSFPNGSNENRSSRGDENQVEFTESDVFETFPEASALARLGFDLHDMARISIDEFSEFSNEDIDASISEFLYEKTYAEQQEFWGALIKGAAKLILPMAKKWGGKLVKKIFKPTAVQAGKGIGKLVNTSIKNRPTLPSGKKKTKFSVFVSLLPQIIQQIQNLPESIHDSGESLLEVELLDQLETLSDAVNHAIEQLLSSQESISDNIQNYELNEALQNLLG